MRIMHILDVRDADVVRHVVDLAGQQIAAGHEVGLVRGEADADRASHERLERLGPSLPLGLHRITLAPRYSLLRDLDGAQRIFTVLRHGKPDVLHAHGQHAGAIGRFGLMLLQKRTGQPLQLIYSPHGQTLGRLGPVAAMLERRLLSVTDGMVFECRFAREQYEKRFAPLPRHVAIVPYGVGENEFTERHIMDTATDFLYVGQLERSGGIDLLVMALARMKRNRLIGALIVGDGSEERELRRQVDRYGLAHQVFFNSGLTRELALLKGTCLVLPARSENFPRVVLEAAAIGMPMILANVGGIRELVGDVAMPLVAPNDVDALVKALDAFLDNPKPLMDHALALKQRVAEHYTVARMAEALNAFYAKVAAGGPIG